MIPRITDWAVGGAACAGAAYLTNLILRGERPFSGGATAAESPIWPRAERKLPSRREQLESLKSDVFDVLIIGGGVTGAGCALDAATRGLRTALVEMDDFASGTSSRSTKMIHGGLRNLQQAVSKFDPEQYRMVREALRERSALFRLAPHLTRSVPIMLPVYELWQVPYYWIGVKTYDILAGSYKIGNSYYLGKKAALRSFPLLKCENLCGAIVYHDGQTVDSRLCLSLALTATRHGATVANHVSVLGLLKDCKGACAGARVKDELTGAEWTVLARCVINATGPFTDSIRKMDDPSASDICEPSSGVHVVLPGYYSPENMGLLDPQTSDGRVIFFLPWLKHTIAGTTDTPCRVTRRPQPTEEEIAFILQEIKNYVNPALEVRRGDVLSAWSGIRPLILDPSKEDTKSLARTHAIEVSKSRLVTIAGGKLTTYRKMAAETIDAALEAVPGLQPTICRSSPTTKVMLEGGHHWSPTMYVELVQDFGLDVRVARHLAETYGDRAFEVVHLADHSGSAWPALGKKIHPEFPYIEAEIEYCVKEYAATATDVIARRLPLAFVNVGAALEALPAIVESMAKLLDWSEEAKKKMLDEAIDFLENDMGEKINRPSGPGAVPIDLTEEQRLQYMNRFKILGGANRGYVTVNEMMMGQKEFGDLQIGIDDLHEALGAIDTNMNGRLELDEYLQLMSIINSGRSVRSGKGSKNRRLRNSEVTVERSCGGM